ncbi:dethiobiotin synthase [Altererythrobacter sp. ZODW24]|uniref:dethiobiotin synthase n=1 Tax=Altererythrobacter sp. ZODW24 TaxID=2185142 RepID=UPI000DF82665|nr:dethiobiotin synthase [Altererythrobacter sp. ZODW24]
MSRYVVTGTDTDVGKTIFAAALAAHLSARYWKPVQAGMDEGGDSATIQRLAGPNVEVLPEAYQLQTPCSPHEAARIDGVSLQAEDLSLPEGGGPLVVEGAGGALVPLSDDLLYADLFATWGLPVIVVARTQLGTINHTLLTLEALRARDVPIHGVAFIGNAEPVAETSIPRIGKVQSLGRLPMIDPLTSEALHAAFAEGITL